MRNWPTVRAIGRSPSHYRDAASFRGASSLPARCLHSSARQLEADQPPKPVYAAPRTQQRTVNRQAMAELSNLPRPGAKEVIRKVRAAAPARPRRRRTDLDDEDAARKSSANDDDEKPQRSGKSRGPRGPRGPQRRRGGAFAGPEPDDDAEDDDDPEQKTMGGALDMNFGEDFANEAELGGYMDLTDTISHIAREWEAASKALTQAQAFRDPAEIREAQGWWSYIDARIRDALAEIRALDDAAFPPHAPTDVDPRGLLANRVGGVAAGAGGTGNTAEDALRHLGARPEHRWEERRALAARVASGAFVKFATRHERDAVAHYMATSKPLLPDAAPFAPLEGPARRAVLERVVAGAHADPGDAALASEPERDAARLVGGRYDARAKGVLLQTLREHLPKPADAGAKGQGQARRKSA